MTPRKPVEHEPHLKKRQDKFIERSLSEEEQRSMQHALTTEDAESVRYRVADLSHLTRLLEPSPRGQTKHIMVHFDYQLGWQDILDRMYKGFGDL